MESLRTVFDKIYSDAGGLVWSTQFRNEATGQTDIDTNNQRLSVKEFATKHGPTEGAIES